MTQKIVLATIGSLGDLHPFIAVGLALKARGLSPVLAVPETNVAKVQSAGLGAAAIFPTFEDIGRLLNMSEEIATARMMRDPDFLFRHVFVRLLPDSVTALNRAAEGAAAIVATPFALAAPIVAEMRGLPLIPAMLQPMTMMSASDPPRSPDFAMLAHGGGRRSLSWNRMMLAVVKMELHRRYGGVVNRVRRSHGLAPLRTAPVFDPPKTAPLTLGLYSSVMGDIQPDYPPNTLLTGFPVFDSDSGAPEALDAELAAFLANGPPPVVFTLGSFAVYAPGDFYRESLAIARLLGHRAVLLTGAVHAPFDPAPDLIQRAYAPHSLVFPHASVIVHHGGIGTTGQALRAGRPQLVVPHLGDQWDNGARIVHLNAGAMISAKRYTVGHAAPLIARLLADQHKADAAQTLASQVNAEKAADTAADAIARVVINRAA